MPTFKKSLQTLRSKPIENSTHKHRSALVGDTLLLGQKDNNIDQNQNSPKSNTNYLKNLTDNLTKNKAENIELTPNKTQTSKLKDANKKTLEDESVYVEHELDTPISSKEEIEYSHENKFNKIEAYQKTKPTNHKPILEHNYNLIDKDSSEEEFVYKITKLSHSYKKMRRLFQFYTLSFAVVIVAMFSFLINYGLTLSHLEKKLSENSVGGVNSSSKESANLAPQVENTASTKNIISFQDNPAIFDYGFKIDIQKNSVSNLNDPNCKTPIVPPTVNGCGFGLNLQNINLPNDGIVFKNLTLETSKTNSKNKIQIDLKDYIKSDFVKTVAVIDTDSNTHKISLPKTIPTSQSLYFRFWATDEVIKINQISIDYYSISDLKPAKIKLSLVNEKLLPDKNLQAMIYADQDEDSKYNKDIDQKWSCESNFPGIKPIKITGSQEFDLTRDDACMTTTKPDNWSENLVLPPGKWLFVVDENNFFSFEIKPDDTSKSVEIKI